MELFGMEVKASTIFSVAAVFVVVVAALFILDIVGVKLAVVVALFGVVVVLVVEAIYTQSIEDDLEFRELNRKFEDDIK